MNDELYKSLKPLLQTPTPRTLEGILNHLDELRYVRLLLAEKRAEALLELLELRPKRLRPKDRDWTDLDRKTEMEGFCAEKEQAAQFLDDLWTLTTDAVRQTELAYQAQSRSEMD